MTGGSEQRWQVVLLAALLAMSCGETKDNDAPRTPSDAGAAGAPDDPSGAANAAGAGSDAMGEAGSAGDSGAGGVGPELLPPLFSDGSRLRAVTMLPPFGLAAN